MYRDEAVARDYPLVERLTRVFNSSCGAASYHHGMMRSIKMPRQPTTAKKFQNVLGRRSFAAPFTPLKKVSAGSLKTIHDKRFTQVCNVEMLSHNKTYPSKGTLEGTTLYSVRFTTGGQVCRQEWYSCRVHLCSFIRPSL